MELNDTSSYQRCFVCGHRNPYGLHLFFRLDQNTIVADFQPREEHQGFPGVIHGGIVAAVLDEALGRTALLGSHPEWTLTGRLEVRYRRLCPTDHFYECVHRWVWNADVCIKLPAC